VESHSGARTIPQHRKSESSGICPIGLVCLIHQTNYLLDQQLRQLERQFLDEGGFTERLYKARVQSRQGSKS
jgi:four helix bundle suffix protein